MTVANESAIRSGVRIAVIGAAGMLGHKLIRRLTLAGDLAGTPITYAALVDTGPITSVGPKAFQTEHIVGDISECGVADTLVSSRPDIIFHLAAVVSGEAEADMDKGYRVNVEGTRLLLEAIRATENYRPRLVFSSSIAAFGTPFPEAIDDDFRTTPQTSYGTQKVIAELLVSEYTRRSYVDGIAIRLPTICVRPGKPNLAASSFFSSIIREPLNGEEAVLPVADTVRHWFASPRAAVGFLIHAAELDSDLIGAVRSMNMPGLSATVAMQLSALRNVAGDSAVALVHRRIDPEIERIVTNWPRSFNATRACALGFQAESTFEEIIRIYIEDELGGQAT